MQDLLRRGRTGGEKKSIMMSKLRKTVLRTNVYGAVVLRLCENYSLRRHLLTRAQMAENL